MSKAPNLTTEAGLRARAEKIVEKSFGGPVKPGRLAGLDRAARECAVGAALAFAAEVRASERERLMESVCSECGNEPDYSQAESACRTCEEMNPSLVTRAQYESKRERRET